MKFTLTFNGARGTVMVDGDVNAVEGDVDDDDADVAVRSSIHPQAAGVVLTLQQFCC